ncbi:unnamed protein product, partial [Mesorhabditis belari]|uniref:DUF5648 domain-containing protein n=1 Tax=Mesorhabditis belari TaxID=2138241 RepID=A0AAF3J611_9BILA
MKSLIDVLIFLPSLAFSFVLIEESCNDLSKLSAVEQENAVNSGYAIEAQMGFIGTSKDCDCPGIVPLYRMWSDSASDHFYTTSVDEMNKAVQDDHYKLEGTMGYCMSAPGSGLLPLYRFWDGKAQDHFYTNNENEKNSVIANLPAYRYEGIQCYVWQSNGNKNC